MGGFEDRRLTGRPVRSQLDLGPRADGFRDELRLWLEANVPDDVEERSALTWGSMTEWTAKLRDAGLVCIAWPVEFGGRGYSGVEVAVMNEEFAHAGIPVANLGMGQNLVGPAIIVHGTDWQKEHFLPRIIDGTDRYCQGFSEPDAGSDLASVATRGVIDGDEVVITGQKVWTSWYWDATMLFCLCRTNPDAPRHKGISYVLVPLDRDESGDTGNGVEFRPIRQIAGESHFAETFLSEARAPVSNVVGGIDNGWRVAMTTLGNERGGKAATQHIQFEMELAGLISDLRERGLTADPIVRQNLAWAHTRVEIMRMTGLRTLSAIAQSRDPGPGGSLNKVFWSEYQRRLGELAVNMLGAESMLSELGDTYRPGRWPGTFLTTRCHTIWGGTAEIQRNIIAEKVLGLPKGPKA